MISAIVVWLLFTALSVVAIRLSPSRGFTAFVAVTIVAIAFGISQFIEPTRTSWTVTVPVTAIALLIASLGWHHRNKEEGGTCAR